jgi:hypothetical protein
VGIWEILDTGNLVERGSGNGEKRKIDLNRR